MAEDGYDDIRIVIEEVTDEGVRAIPLPVRPGPEKVRSSTLSRRKCANAGRRSRSSR